MNPLYGPDAHLALIFQTSYVICGILTFIIVRHKFTQQFISRLYDAIFLSGHGSERKVQDDFEIRGSDALIRDIEARISNLRGRANFILTIIVISLICGVALVIFSGRLTSIDAEAASNLGIVKDEVASLVH